MKRIALIILLLILSCTLNAQDIVAVEYFIDTDPGHGNGRSVALTPSSTINGLVFELDISDLTEGVHTLFIRALDENGLWSQSYARPIYKALFETPAVPNITRIEYYIDEDPGFGTGAEIPITPSTLISDLDFSVPLNGVAVGTHTLFVRAQDDQGNWSLVYSKDFNKVSTPSATNPELNDLIYELAFNGTSTPVSIKVTGGTAPYSLLFYSRKIAERSFTSRELSSSGDNSYETLVDDTMLDDLGIEFYFQVTDANGVTAQSERHYIYRASPTEGTIIPFSLAGGTAQSYQIFSIPYQLEDNLIASIFDELGEYKKSQWRLVRYQAGKNVDYGAGINRIELGKGYWFNRKQDIDIGFSGGTVAQVNQATDAVIHLEPGWNQIGNPFPFDVDWDDILAANPDVALVGNLKVFNPEGFHLNDESNTLKTWSGGFVHNGNSQRVDLRLPVVLRNSAGGRKSSSPSLPKGTLDAPDWFVPITISQGKAQNKLSGIGMHRDASESVDRFDDFVAPRFLNYLEFYTRHNEFFTTKFSRDIVPTANSFTWDIEFESNDLSSPVTFSWNPDRFGLNDAKLFLFDVAANVLVDMRAADRYQFKGSSKRTFKILYGSSRGDIDPDITSLGKAYPNPFSSETTIPFIIAGDGRNVVIDIVDLSGKPVSVLANSVYKKGIYQVTWKGTDGSGDPVSSGVYLYRMKVDGKIMAKRLIKK